MLKQDDFYSVIKVVDLKSEASEGKTSNFGKAIIRYEVHKYQDVSNLHSKNAYLVSMSQRIIVPNQNSYTPGAQHISSYENYPALLKSKVDVSCPTGMNVLIKSLFPRTLNSTVSMTKSSGDNNSKTVSNESTRGSSVSNINTYGVSASAGFMGDMPMGSVSGEYSHSTEKTRSRSSSIGQSSGSGHNSGRDESMSVKDWSSYSQLDSSAVSPSWVWGQGYPWDVILYNQQASDGSIQLPTFVQNLLVSDGYYVLPPSELSLFGIDFTMNASWVFEAVEDTTFDDSLTFTHDSTYFTASHELTAADKLRATLQTENQASNASNTVEISSLSAFALNPLGLEVSGGSIGFTAHTFLVPPTTATEPFKIVSTQNNIQVTGTGFTAGLTTDFSVTPTLDVIFKVSDTTVDYAFHLMHWIGNQSGGCALTWTINDKYSGVILVSAPEGQGGEGNISTIELRNSDYSSISFHDYLVVGTNTLHIEIAPVGSASDYNYTVFAMAITG
ncbi:hypothetical protein [Dickeya oryzae]|uniref:hypothetical protein n=1 Tax=Dickeya oryzae TaxID=1240404 RepID=UPI001AECD388|nr:hypothetical protein [Dickeya oryzae]MBP2847806.1 hypothetical protein [Dickeya oryzae]